MRVLGFSKKWDKLKKQHHTTFRFPRADRDWEVGETVQEVYHPRGKDREVIQFAKIISKTPRDVFNGAITLEEAREDGFASVGEMTAWFRKTYGNNPKANYMNCLLLEVQELPYVG